MPTLFNIVDAQQSLSARRSKWQVYGGQVEQGLRQTPTAQNTSLLKIMRDDLDQDTRDVEDAIASLKAKLQILEKGKQRIEQLKTRISAGLAPIRTLSDDILLRIFMHAVDATPLNVEDFYNTHGNLAEVHPTWERVISDLPRNLFVSSLEIHDVQYNEFTSFAMEELPRRPLHVDFRGDSSSWEHLLSFPDRLESLRMTITRQQWDMLLPIAGSLHTLHSIALEAIDDYIDEPWSDVLSLLPSLTSVSFTGSSTRGRLTSVPLGRLTHFSDTRQKAVVSPDFYLDLLQQTPSLVSIELQTKENPPTTNPLQRNLVMLNLRRLTISDRTMLTWFSSLPVLEHLGLALPWTDESLQNDYVASPFQLAYELIQRWGFVETLTSLSFGEKIIPMDVEEFPENFSFLQRLVSTLCRRLVNLQLSLETSKGAPFIDNWMGRLNPTIEEWCSSGEKKSLALNIWDCNSDPWPQRLAFISEGLVSLILDHRLHLEVTIARWVRGGEVSVILSVDDRRELRKQKELGESDLVLLYYNTSNGKTVSWLDQPAPPPEDYDFHYNVLTRTYSSDTSGLPASQNFEDRKSRRSDSVSTIIDGNASDDNVNDNSVDYDYVSDNGVVTYDFDFYDLD